MIYPWKSFQAARRYHQVPSVHTLHWKGDEWLGVVLGDIRDRAVEQVTSGVTCPLGGSSPAHLSHQVLVESRFENIFPIYSTLSVSPAADIQTLCLGAWVTSVASLLVPFGVGSLSSRLYPHGCQN